MALTDDFALGQLDIHAWLANLDEAVCTGRPLAAVLSEEERRRAAGFRFDADRNRFMAAHGILRSLLGRYLKEDPAEIRFEGGLWEKPRLSQPWNATGIYFSMSHSQNYGLFAVSRNRTIGADVECIRNISDMDSISRSNFSPEEHRALVKLPQGDRQPAFFRCWTRKESYIKAIGLGLSYPLGKFGVSADEAPGGGIYRIDHTLGKDWSIWDIPAGPLAVAAIAAMGSGMEVSCRRWEASSNAGSGISRKPFPNYLGAA